jgi:prephenate dehydrogenase
MSEPKAPGEIAIIGLGLIGASLGLAMKSGGVTSKIAGYDTKSGAGRTAEKMGAVDRVASTPADAVSGASIVIVAVPIVNVREAFTAIAPHLSDGSAVTDTASTKAEVLRWAREILPAHVDFVGGHPMAGKETPGTEQAEASLFRGKPYCICPTIDASPGAIKAISGLAAVVGADPLFMEPDEHDQYAAAVSHMPLMASTALFSLIRSSGSWDDLGAVAGPGFKDMTRLASGDPALAMGIWRTNREALIHWLDRMIGELGRYREMLKDAQDEKLLEAFTEAQVQRDSFLLEPPVRVQESTEVPVDKGKALMDMLIGAKLADNLRRAMPPEPGEKLTKEEQAAPRISMADKVAEGVRRDLEKLEAERAAKDAATDAEKPPE